MVRTRESIEITQNIRITVRERGKIVARRESSNIFLDSGREWISKLISLDSYSPDVPRRNDRIKYMGFGIGGTRQLALPTANASPLVPAYSGPNLQTDQDPEVTALERPVRLSGSQSNYPGLAGDAWIGEIQAPADFSIPKEVTYTRVVLGDEISYGPFQTVPLSEIGLFTSSSDPENYQNVPVAYDTFDTMSKTAATAFEVIWTFRF